MQAGMVTLTTTSTPDHSREQLTLSSVQESSQTSTERLQRKRRATEPVFSSSIQKGVTCANPKLLYQVLYNATQGALSNRSTLERNCQNVGLQFHGETPGNGNCFFEAVSSQLQRLKYPVQLSPQQLRQDAVAFLKDNQLLQVSDGYINLAEFMYNESFEEYCARMAEDGEWADHILVVAMARTLQRDIMIVTSAPASGNDDNVAWVVGQDNFQGDPILLGHIWEHHYESLEPTDSTELEVKCQRHDVEKMGFEANDTKNQIDMFGKYGGQAVFLGAPAYNQDTINPIQVPMNQMNMFGSYRGDNVMMGFSGDNNSGQINPFQYDPHIQMNQMSMLGSYRGDNAMLVISGDNNSGQRNPFQYAPQVHMNQMNMFRGSRGNNVRMNFSGNNNAGQRNPFQYDPQIQMNQMSRFGNDGGDKAMTVFSGDHNFGIGNPVQYDPHVQYDTHVQYDPHVQYDTHVQYDPQVQMNQVGLFGNDGGDKAMTVFSGDDNFGIGNPVQYVLQVQYDPHFQMNQMNMFGNNEGYIFITDAPIDNIPGLNPTQYDLQDQMNLMDVFGNYGDHTNMPSVPIDNRTSLINPIQDDVQSQMLIAEDSSDHSQYLEESSEYSFDSDDFDYESMKRRKHRKLGQKYLKEIRSYLSDKPTIIHLVDKDFSIDNTIDDDELEKLKRTIFEVASQQPYWGEQIPTRWFLLEQQLIKLRDAGVKVISRSDVEKLNNEGTVQIKDSEEMDLFLTYLHETGTIIYFNIEVLKDNIILDPIWLIDALKLLINAHPNLPECLAENKSQSDNPVDSAIGQKWRDFKDKGILSPELVDALWTKEKHPQLHANKDHLLRVMEQFNIIAKPVSFSKVSENKVEEYFLTPCMLREECPKEVISPERDQRIVSTPVLCYIFRGKYLPPPIFHRLIADCITRWPVAKKKETQENLIFCGCCVFNLDLFHRLTLYCRSHIVFARITRMVNDEVKTVDAKLCTKVRMIISRTLTKITSYLSQNLQYGMSVQCPQYHDDDSEVGFSPLLDVWFAEEGHADDATITQEQINYFRLCVALITVCGNAMREVLRRYVPVGFRNIFDAILAIKNKLISGKKCLLNPNQITLVYPGPQKTGTLDQFDISLLYVLIRNVNVVKPPLNYNWGENPCDQPRDTSLWASVERIRLFRNHIIHSLDGQISDKDLEDYWNKFEAVIKDIETVIGVKVCSQMLEKLKNMVVSAYEAF
ncbi:hypothetical protein ACJMK2_001817 [Sinanodonta woodiana]|uniref:OTU domain-containing protein n=1 Tax=Sinanodonta woodiana TaxID=1069815 RepID=A0ABD3XWJ2_SINWO